MRDLSDEEQALAYRVWTEADRRGFPDMDKMDFRGDGYLSAWGREVGWMHIIRDAELADLRLILDRLLTNAPVTRSEPVYPVIKDRESARMRDPLRGAFNRS